MGFKLHKIFSPEWLAAKILQIELATVLLFHFEAAH
jgi:hypothetical protein